MVRRFDGWDGIDAGRIVERGLDDGDEDCVKELRNVASEAVGGTTNEEVNLLSRSFTCSLDNTRGLGKLPMRGLSIEASEAELSVAPLEGPAAVAWPFASLSEGEVKMFSDRRTQRSVAVACLARPAFRGVWKPRL